jgi:hypothetical protein
METKVRKVQSCRSSGGCFFGKGQGLWETLASMTYPQLLLIWLKIPIRT